MNSHARFAAHTAKALGYGFRSLDGDDCYLFEISKNGRSAAFPVGYATPYALNNARAYSLARDKAFTTRVLDEAGLPTIPFQLFFANDRMAAYRGPGREPADARAWARTEAAFPIFCKPNQGSKGDFAEIVEDGAQFDDYLARVAEVYDVILAQPFLRGVEHRVIVLKGEALFCYKKASPALLGDGVSPVRALIEKSRETWKGAALLTPVERLRVRDGEGETVSHARVLAKGETVFLEGRANRAAGGDAEEVLTSVPPHIAALGRAAAAAIGLDFAGIDLFDVSPARDLSRLVVIEVNANPAIETLEAQGRFDLIEAIWGANFEAALKAPSL